MKIYKTSFDIHEVEIDDLVKVRKVFHVLIKDLDLTSHADFAAQFPTPWGAGGSGITAIQSFTESYMAMDTWPGKKYANLYICSCKKYDPDRVKRVLSVIFPKAKIIVESLGTVVLK